MIVCEKMYSLLYVSTMPRCKSVDSGGILIHETYDDEANQDQGA